MHASVAAVVLGGSQEAADAAPRRPPASPLAQVCASCLSVPATTDGLTAHSRPACQKLITCRELAADPPQVEAVGRALPRIPAVPADLLAQHALQDAADAAASAAGAEAEAPDCLEACCLRDDLHLFMCGGVVAAGGRAAAGHVQGLMQAGGACSMCLSSPT